MKEPESPQSIDPIFSPGIKPVSGPADADLIFLFHNGDILVYSALSGETIPRFLTVASMFDGREPVATEKVYIGDLAGDACYIADLTAIDHLPPDCSLHPLRSLFDHLPPYLIALTGRAAQLHNWEKTHQYCSRCGQSLNRKTDERARYCSKCDLVVYPRISPAMIVAVVRDNRLLLARASRFPSGLYSVLAGFVDIGESLEECVRREVREEVGLEIKNIAYFGSQPWPFPDSLMIGFTAEYESGDLAIDGNEIKAADWYSPAALPKIPSRISIARRLIDWFIEQHQQD